MTRIVVIFGLIASAITSALMMGTMPLHKSGVITHENGYIVGYTGIVIAMTTIFFGIKSYRDNQLGGTISFGRAAGVGLLIALFAAVAYAITWEFYLDFFEPNFMSEYVEACISSEKAKGTTGAELELAISRYKEMEEMYKNPIARFGMTMMEPFPVGLLMALIFAAVLKKKEFLPATPTA